MLHRFPEMTINNSSRIASVAGLLVIFAALVEHGEAIVCYQCNSAFDPRCGDPFDPYSLGTVNCSFQPRLEHINNIEATLCRKISQKVYGKIRVVRGCGYSSNERTAGKCIRRTGTHDVSGYYCECADDLCNSATEKLPWFGIVEMIGIIVAFVHI